MKRFDLKNKHIYIVYIIYYICMISFELNWLDEIRSMFVIDYDTNQACVYSSMHGGGREREGGTKKHVKSGSTINKKNTHFWWNREKKNK